MIQLPKTYGKYPQPCEQSTAALLTIMAATNVANVKMANLFNAMESSNFFTFSRLRMAAPEIESTSAIKKGSPKYSDIAPAPNMSQNNNPKPQNGINAKG